MFAKKRTGNHDPHHQNPPAYQDQHRRASSSISTNATHRDTSPTAVETPLVSPLQMTFDFELSPSSTADYTPLSPFSPIVERESEPPAARPQTSHGVGGLDQRETGKAFPSFGSFGPQAPMLPAKPRVASTTKSYVSSTPNPNGVQDQGSVGNTRARDDSDNVSVKSTKSALKARLSFEHPIDMLPPLSRPNSPGGSRPQTPAGPSNGSTPRMESSLFPGSAGSAFIPVASKYDTPISPSTPSVPAMSRQFIDSRDKPYGPPPQRPVMLQQHHSSPNLFRPQAPAIVRPPLPIPMPSSGNNFVGPTTGMQNTSQKTNPSASTVRPTTRASTHTGRSNSLVTTIGTPYQATADSFPLPQHVMTRPKTPGAAAQIGGVSVPTHHTSSSRTANGARPVETKETKRKRRLTLNPIAFLQRRQTAQHPEELVQQRHEQAQALQRQRDLVVSGVQKPAPDFDPRIKGRVVHDFSVPRGKRNTFDEIDMAGMMMSPDGRQGSISSPIVPVVTDFPPRNASLVNRGRLPDRTERRSIHTPQFKEHLEEMPESSNRVSSIQAESLENREFLQRVAKHKSASAESAILPPFARRSQVLDPAQAAFYDDDESKTSSSSEKPRTSNLSSGSAVSPVTARSSQQIPPAEVAHSLSPVSPSSPGKPEDSFRPLSDITPDMNVPRPLSSTSAEQSQDGDFETVSELNQLSPQEKKDRFITEVTTRPYSVVMAPPAIYAVSEGSNESSPVSSPARHHDDQQFKVVMRGVSIRQSKSIEGLGITAESQSPPLPDRSASRSPASQESADQNAILQTLEKTPEPDRAQSIQFKPDNKQPKLVEKRASAVGHTRKSSNVPRHASNASRFSFQFGGNESAAQERALEDKHRKMGTDQKKQPPPRSRSPGEEDEEDDFDEDAMYDMDEMEMQGGQEEPVPQVQVTVQSANYLHQARQMLQQHDSDDESHYGDDLPNVTKEEDLPYPDHPAFRTHSAVFNDYSRPNSFAAAAQGGYWRDSTIDHYMRDSYYPADGSQGQASGSGVLPNSSGESLAVPTDVTNIAPQRSNLYMQPHAELPSPVQVEYKDAKPSLPLRDSGNSEQNRVVSGMSFGNPSTTGSSSDHQGSTSESNSNLRERITSAISSSSISEPITSPFYLQADSAKSSPHLVGPYSPPFPIHLTDDEGAGDESPQREAALVSLEANSRIRADSLSGEDNSLASSSRAAQPMRASKPITLASPPKRSGGHAKPIAANGIDISHPSNSQPAQHQREKPRDEVTLKSPTQSKKAEFTAADQNVGSPKEVNQQPVVPIGSAIHAAGSPSHGSPRSQDKITESRNPQTSPPVASTALGSNMFGGFDFEEFNDVAGSLPDLPQKSYHNRDILPAGNDVNATTSAALIGHGKSASFQQSITSTQGDQKRVLGSGTGKSDDSISNTAGSTTFGRFGKNGTARSDSNISPNAIPPKETLPAQILGSPSTAVPFVATPTSDRRTLSGHDHGDAPTKNLPPQRESISPTSQHARFDVALAESAKPKAASADNADEMYFDDGNFDHDLSGVDGGTIDENAFDDDSFLSRPGLTNRYMHTRDLSAMSALSIGSDGPYPTFAIPNAHVQRVSQRYSQLMLEDLPLQAGPVDPKYIPQRNPSEDAKRLGMSNRVPPVPVPETDPVAFTRMQQSLQSYHSALADAANRAAAEGRFLRAPSISTQYSADLKPDDARGISDARSIADDRSQYSNGEEGGEIHMPYSKHGSMLNRKESNVSHLTHITTYSPPKMSFDFGFDEVPNDDIIDDDSFGNDDDLVAAANAEVLASDVEGFYGQEFDFYGRPRSNSGGSLDSVNGGYFGPDGDDGLMRNKSVKEPSLTPITERSEFSTRSSFVGLNTGPFGPASAALYGAMSPAIARMPHSPIIDGPAPQSLDELRRLRGQAFGGGGGSNSSYRSNSNRSSSQSLQALSPIVDTRPGPHSSGYFGQIGAGGVQMQYGYSTSSNGSRNSSVPNSAHPGTNNNAGFGGFLFHDSPQSAASSNGIVIDSNNNTNNERTEFSTPRKPPGGLNLLNTEPVTAKKVNATNHSHSRSGSGADSVTYVREPDVDGKQRWVLERRKTSDQGQLELIGRELVQGGWI